MIDFFWFLGTFVFILLNYMWLRQEDFHFIDYLKFVIIEPIPVILNLGYVIGTILTWY